MFVEVNIQPITENSEQPQNKTDNNVNLQGPIFLI